MGWLSRWSGLEAHERRRVFRCFCALAALLLSYYMVKPLRDSQFLKEFEAGDLRWIYLVSSLFCLLVTRVFQWCSDRFSRKAVVTGTFAWVLACKLLFFVLLHRGGHGVTIAFFLWASVYFLLLAATLWGCFNERFGNEAGERCFPYIALGAPLGTIAGSQLAGWTAAWGYASLLGSALGLVLALVCLWPEFRYPVRARLHSPVSHDESPMLAWLADPILRAIGVMVIALAVYTTVTNLTTQRLLDRQIGRAVFEERLSPLSSSWTYEQFSQLRHLQAAQQQERLRQLARERELPPEQLQSAYAQYQSEREKELRRLFAGISEGQGILSILLLGLCCRPLIRRFGVGTGALAMPTFALLSIPLLMLPLNVLSIQVLLVVGGSLNYSLNNVTKEMLYTVTSRAAIVKAKPFIEGPLMRFGDVFCATLTLSAAWLVRRLGLAEEQGDWLVVACALALAAHWWRQVRRAGQIYASATDRVVERVEQA